MKSKFDFRQISISACSAFLSALLLGLAGFYQDSANVFRFLIYVFVWLGAVKFITGVFDIISPVQSKQTDPKELANKAIVKEFFK